VRTEPVPCEQTPKDEEPDLDTDATRTQDGGADDASLLRAVQRGDEDALAALYDRYAGVAYGLAYRVTNDGTAAEDAVQEAYISLWKQAPRFDPARGNVRSWLLTIVHHKAVDAVRRRANRFAAPLPDGAEEFLAGHDRPDEIAEWSMEAEAVREAVRQVPVDQRRTIEMAYFEGLTHVEIAERTGVPLGTVKSRLRIGLEKMRVYLRPKVLE
jgi:RNA polymerase sigma-70 factor (ECF subfamily)